MSASKLKHLLVVVVIVCTAAIITYLLKSKPEPPTKPEQETAWTVNVMPLEYVDRAPELNLLGTVESVQNTLITSRVNTTVTATPALAGSLVKQGDILIKLDPVEVNVVLTQRQADVNELSALIAVQNQTHKANLSSLKTEKNLLRLAENALARQKSLVKNNVTSKERLDNAEVALQQQNLALTNRQLSVNNHQNRLNQLQARLQRAQAQLTLAELDMAQTELSAPFDGWVISVHVAAGNRVRNGEPLIELVARDSLEVRAQVPNRWVPIIQQMLAANNPQQEQAEDQDQGREQGQSKTQPNAGASAIAEIFGQPTQLQLHRLSAAASASTGGIDAFFRPSQGNHLLLGKAVSLRVSLPEFSQAFALPVSAIYGFDRIYRVDENERLAAATITRTGRFQGEDDAEWILFAAEDLKPGDLIITTQLPNAVTGLKVKRRE